jgi:hypothetical protein
MPGKTSARRTRGTRASDNPAQSLRVPCGNPAAVAERFRGVRISRTSQRKDPAPQRASQNRGDLEG